MLDVTVKTLDGRNRSFSVPDDITVKQFKEKIAASIEISADTQRLIFQGRVLQDEKNLNDFDVNGKTLHVVQRAPPSSTSSTPSTGGSTSTTMPPGGQGPHGTQTFVGSFSIPADAVDPNQVQNIVSNVLSGMGDVGRNARIQTRSSGDGSAVDVHINLGQMGSAPIHGESQNRIIIARRMLARARRALDRLENPPASTNNAESEESETMDTTPSGDATPSGDVTPSGDITPSRDASPSRDGSPATTEEATEMEQPSTEEQPAAEGVSPEPATAQADTTATDNTGSQTTNNNGQQTPTQPRLSAMADLLQEVFEVNQRLQPHLERYRDFMAQDPDLQNNNEEATATQSLCNRVSEVMHCISHAYHSLSDILVDTRQATPRTLRATPVIQPSAIIQQAIPVQAQISVAHISPRGSPSLQRRATSSTTSSATSSATSTTPTAATTATTTTTQQQPQPQPQVRWPGGFPMRFPQAPVGGGPMPGLGGSQPYMFMDIGPQGIAINSITAEIVNGSGAPVGGGVPTSTPVSTSSTTSQSSQPHVHAGPIPGGPAPGGLPPFMPPGVFQNILQMAQQAAMSGQPGHQVFVISQGGAMPGSAPTPSTVQANSTSTSTSSSTSTQPTAGPQPPPASRQSPSTQQPPSAPQPSNAVPPRQPAPNAAPNGSGGPRPRGAAFIMPGPRQAFMPPGMPGIPGLPGLAGMHMLNAVDPLLPCQSRFFLRRRLAASANATPAGTAPQPLIPGQIPEQALSGIVDNLVSSIVNQATHTAAGGGLPPTVTATSTASTTSRPTSQGSTGTTGQPSVIRPPGMAGPDPPAILQLRNLLQNAQNQASPTATTVSSSQSATATSSSTSSTSTSSSQSAGSRPAPSPMGDEMFAQLVRGIGSYVSQAAMGQQASDSIYDFVSALGQDYNSESEGLLNEIFMCVSRHLTIVDLMSIFCQQTAPLQRLVLPLQEFVRDRVLQGAEPTDENLDDAINRLTEEMLPQIEEICTEAPVRDNIDYPASVQELMRHHLRLNARLILDARENDGSFGNTLYANVRTLMHEFLVLSRCCLQGGQSAVENMVQANVRRISTDINPLIQQWMGGMTTQQIQAMMRVITISEDQVQRYIVRCAEMESQPSSEASFMSCSAEKPPSEADQTAIAAATIATEVPGCEPVAANQTEAMDVDGSDIPSPSQDCDNVTPRIDPAILRRLPPPPRRGEAVNVVLGSEGWHSQVPADWVPIIEHDIQTQQRQTRQAPFSDAYINGMPAKKRKLMNKSSAESSELTDIKTILPQAIEKAADAVGAEPRLSLSDMTRDASTSTALQAAFQHEMNQSIHKRIAEDPDYIPEKYPNSEKFYKKK